MSKQCVKAQINKIVAIIIVIVIVIETVIVVRH